MTELILILSSIFLISTYGMYAIVRSLNDFERPRYTCYWYVQLIPLTTGFILPVFNWSILIDIHWLILFACNFVVTLLLGVIIAGIIRRIIPFHRDIGVDSAIHLIIGVVLFIIGLISHFISIK